MVTDEQRPWSVVFVVEDHHIFGRVSGYKLVHHVGDDVDFGWFADGHKANAIAEMLNRFEERVTAR